MRAPVVVVEQESFDGHAAVVPGDEAVGEQRGRAGKQAVPQQKLESHGHSSSSRLSASEGREFEALFLAAASRNSPLFATVRPVSATSSSSGTLARPLRSALPSGGCCGALAGHPLSDRALEALDIAVALATMRRHANDALHAQRPSRVGGFRRGLLVYVT